MSVVTELDRFIAIQERSIEHLQAKIQRRADRGKPSLESERALAGVRERLASTRTQRTAVMEVVEAGLRFQIAVMAIFQAGAEGLTDEKLMAFLADGCEAASTRFVQAAIACAGSDVA